MGFPLVVLAGAGGDGQGHGFFGVVAPAGAGVGLDCFGDVGQWALLR